MDDATIYKLFEDYAKAIMETNERQNKIMQALIEDYIVHISSLTGKSQAEVFSRIEEKIKAQKPPLFVVT
jgi:hypothetical protein